MTLHTAGVPVKITLQGELTAKYEKQNWLTKFFCNEIEILKKLSGFLARGGKKAKVEPFSYGDIITEKNIVDINKVITPHLCVTDASIAVVRGGFKYGLWVGTPPTRLDTVIAGINNVSVDAVGIKLLQRDPWSIGHIKHAVEQGLGVCDIQQLSIISNIQDAVLEKKEGAFRL